MLAAEYLDVGAIDPRTGVPLTSQQVTSGARKRGVCVVCGRRTHEKKFHLTGVTMDPITVEGLVLDGRCLTCFSVEPSTYELHDVAVGESGDNSGWCPLPVEPDMVCSRRQVGRTYRRSQSQIQSSTRHERCPVRRMHSMESAGLASDVVPFSSSTSILSDKCAQKLVISKNRKPANGRSIASNVCAVSASTNDFDRPSTGTPTGSDSVFVNDVDQDNSTTSSSNTGAPAYQPGEMETIGLLQSGVKFVPEITDAMFQYPTSSGVQQIACNALRCSLSESLLEITGERDRNVLSFAPEYLTAVFGAMENIMVNHSSNTVVLKEACNFLWTVGATWVDNIEPPPSLLNSIAVTLRVVIEFETSTECASTIGSRGYFVAALGALSAFALRLSDNQSSIVSGDGIATVLLVMQRYQDDVILQEWSCRCLASLDTRDGCITDIVREVTSTMNRLSFDASIQRWGLAALYNVAAGNVRTDDVISVSIAAMQKHPSVMNVQENACAVLSTCLFPRSGAITIDHFDVIVSAIVAGMDAFPRSWPLQMNATAALMNCRSDVDALYSAGAMSAIVRSMAAEQIGCGQLQDGKKGVISHLELVELNINRCDLLLLLCVENKERKRSAVSQDCVMVMVGILQDYWDSSAALQQRAVSLILSLAVAPENLQAIAASRASESFAFAVKRNATEWGKHKDLFFLMCRLACKVFAGGHGDLPTTLVQTTIGLMNADIFDEDLQSRGCSFLSYSCLSCEEIKRCILSSGAINAILQAMQANPDHSTLQVKGCAALAIIVTSYARNDVCEETSALLNMIGAAIANHNEHEMVVEYACLTLHNLFSSGTDAALADIFKIMKGHLESAAVQRAVLSALWSLSESAETRFFSELQSGDGVAIIQEAMRLHPEIQLDACCVLWNIFTKSYVPCVTRTLVESVVEVMRDNVDNIAVQERACALLSWWSDDKEILQLLAGVDITVRTAIGAILNHPAEHRLVNDSCKLLANVSLDKRSRLSIADMGGVQAISDAMRDHLQSCDLQGAGCFALYSLASGDIKSRVFQEADAMRRVVSAMKSCADAAFVQDHSLDFLREMSLMDARNKVLIADSGGIDATVESMQKYIRDEKIQEKACILLWSLSVNSDNQTAVAHAGGVEAIINAMLAHISQPEVQKSALGALASLAVKSESNKLLCDKNGIAAIVFAMRAHFQLPDIQVSACSALSNIAADPGVAVLNPSTTEGVDAIVCAMFCHQNSATIQELCCLALYNISLKATSISILQTNANIRVALLFALREYPIICERAEFVLSLLSPR